MGITGLLSFVKPASKSVHVSELKGQTVAIDSYCWMHKGAFGCADKIVKGEDTDAYVNYCFKFIDMLRSFKITPIMVFDGQNLPAKSITEVKRRENRAAAKKKAIECLRLNKTGEARMNFIKAVDVSPEMALKLIKACRKHNIDCIVAPYEADAQLAYMNQKGIVDCVITEDSDLLVFGCKKVLFKLDISGNGTLVESENLYLTMNESPESYNLDKFRHMCILSGCDYFESLPGVGLKKALKFIKANSNADIYDMLPKLPATLNLKNLVVTKEYREGFMTADATFRHQLVFDPQLRQLTPLTDPEIVGTKPEHCCNAGDMKDNNLAYQLALGNLSPDDLKIMDNWCPDRELSPYAFKPSIWSKSYKIHPKRKHESTKEYKITEICVPKTKGTNVVCDVKLLNLITENEIKMEEKIKSDIEKMYFDEPPLKKICLDLTQDGEKIDSSQKENENSISPVLNRKRLFVKSRFFSNDNKNGDESHNLSKNTANSEICDSMNNIVTESTVILMEKLDNNSDVKSSCESLTNSFKFVQCSSEIVTQNNITLNTASLSDKIQSEKYDIIECEVKLTKDSLSLERTESLEPNIVKEEKKSTILMKSTSCRKPGLARKNSNNKFTASKNQPKLSMFFKKT